MTSTSKARVLIVEDALIVAMHLQRTLEREGYEVLGVEGTGESALALIETDRPDIVLMDIMLKGELDGIETARLIRSRYYIPVVYLTALTDYNTIQRAKVTEPFGFLTKPIEDRELFTVIEMALYKHGMESRLRQSEEKFHATVMSISDGVLIVDEQFQVVFMNPSAQSATGWSLHEALGRDVFTVFSLKDRSTEEFPVNPFKNALDRARVNTLPDNLALICRSGNEHPVGEGSMSPILKEDGVIIGMVIIFKDIADRVARDKLMKEFEKRHLAALLEGQEQERSRIARDLHDGLGQLLNAIKMNISLLGKKSGRVRTLSTLIDEAIHESVRISENLVPAKLRDFDVATCLRSLCQSVTKTSGVKVSFESLSCDSILEQGQKINLYRIAQEAVSNAVRHSFATSINVQLNEEDDMVQLMIEDDGNGFERKKRIDKSKHHGLANMKDRAEIMGGKMTIESDPDRGTLVIIEAPINK